jgi:hypothetical protein
MLKTIKLRYYLKDMISYWRLFRNSEQRQDFLGHHIDGQEENIHKSKKLHASTYLARGFVDQDEIEDEVIKYDSDPHPKNSHYFMVTSRKNGNIVATARQIRHGLSGEGYGLPVLDTCVIYSRYTQLLQSYDKSKIVEISALVKQKNVSKLAPLYLYRQMWRHSLSQDHEVWLMACDVRLYNRLKILAGPALHKIGQETAYKGGNVIPCMIEPESALSRLIDSTIATKNPFKKYIRAQLIKFFVEDISANRLDSKDVNKLKVLGLLK